MSGRGSADDTAVREVLAPMAGRTSVEVADRLDSELPSLLRDDAGFLVIRPV